MTAPTRPSAETLWRLAVRDGHTGNHDMAWTRRRYADLLEEYGVDREKARDMPPVGSVLVTEASDYTRGGTR